ncbi:MAG: hypothetical protein GXO57_00415, partial [Thermodesulfobacteria bacterium]|nr:hypothetical protein [Thermodesulfobacteriota bacterium]
NYSDWEREIDKLLKKVKNEEFKQKRLKEIKEINLNYYNYKKITKAFSTPIALEIPYTFERFKRQFSCFVLQGGFLSNSQNSVKFLNNYLKKEVLEVLIIPKECKSHIEKQLRLCGIDESLIYPDEISKIYRSIKKRIEIYLNLNLI